MQQTSKKNVKTVSEKVTDLLLHPNGSDDSEESGADEATAPKVVDFDEEYELPDGRSTDIRKRNVKLLSEQSVRYKGKIATRKELEEDSDDQSDDGEDDEQDDDDSDNAEENALNAFSMKLKNSSNGVDFGDDSDSDEQRNENDMAGDDDDDEDDDDDGEEEDDFEGDDDEESDDDDDVEAEDGNNMIAATNQQAEIEKGKCVQNQLRIWERLLELRIHSQKLLTKCNQLPEPLLYQQQQHDNEELQAVSKEATENVTKLLRTLVGLQSALSGQFSELQTAMKGSLKRPTPFEEDTDTGAPPIKRVAEHLQQHFGKFRTYRNAVLLKWDDRTKLLTPGAGAKKRTMHEEYDIIRKIDNALMNRTSLIEKTQITKNNQQQQQQQQQEEAGDEQDKRTLVVANEKQQQLQQRNVNVYDDSDFYHQQLRELIEYKANTSTNMTEVTKQFVELQKLRQKMKKKVDTRASKGRKIRYTVHNKLVNFMAPHDASTWTEDSKNELYKSLFAT